MVLLNGRPAEWLPAGRRQRCSVCLLIAARYAISICTGLHDTLLILLYIIQCFRGASQGMRRFQQTSTSKVNTTRYHVGVYRTWSSCCAQFVTRDVHPFQLAGNIQVIHRMSTYRRVYKLNTHTNNVCWSTSSISCTILNVYLVSNNHSASCAQFVAWCTVSVSRC